MYTHKVQPEGTALPAADYSHILLYADGLPVILSFVLGG